MDQCREDAGELPETVPHERGRKRARDGRTGQTRPPFRYTRRDWLIAALLTAALLLAAAGTLRPGLADWGDDSAAYLSEGIAIADGTFREQVKKNYILHPSALPGEAGPEGLVYVWGYPLMLSAVYRLVGFDREAYSSILWYKMPLALCLALTGGVLYLFYRRRFSEGVSAVLSAAMCLYADLYENMDSLYSDVPFLFFSILTLFLTEVFAESARPGGRSGGDPGERKSRAKSLALAVLFGAALWFTRETRLSGTAVCAAAALGHAVILRRDRTGAGRGGRWVHAIPYLVLLALVLVSERILLAPATSNLSDVGSADPAEIPGNIRYYAVHLLHFLKAFSGTGSNLVGVLLAGAALLGVVRKGITENIHLTLLFVGTFAADVLLPYWQGLRYMYNVLPILLMYTAYGLQFLWRRLGKAVGAPSFVRSGVRLCAAVLLLFMPLLTVLRLGAENLTHQDRRGDEDVYSAEAIDMYRFIRRNVPADSIIAFGKPRSLYLNTERMSVRPGVNGHTVSQADYYLESEVNHALLNAGRIARAMGTPMTEVYSNRLFTLYTVDKG